ncbi:MAG: TVP38/TMEM64 family protein [Acidobacteriota bacterium]
MKTLASTGLIFLLIALIIASVYFLLYKFEISLKDIRGYIESYDHLAPWVYMGVIAVAMLTAFTAASPVVIIGGAIFGWLPALAYTLLGGLVGTSLAFFIGRYFGRGLLVYIKGPSILEKIEQRLPRKFTFKAILLLRLLPHPLYDVVGYASGFTNISYFKYIVATGFGAVPGIFILTYFANLIGTVRFLAGYIALWVAILLFLVYYYRRTKYQKESITNQKHE